LTTQAGWNHLRACVKCLLVFNAGICNVGMLVANIVGCETNNCLCRPSILGEAIEVFGDEALQLCSNYDDQRTATSFLSQYCANKGYTSIEYPSTVAAETTGASTVTAPVFTTVTETIRSEGSLLLRPPCVKVFSVLQGHLERFFLPTTLTSPLWLCWWLCEAEPY
jgi:hypothetical protein